MKTKLLYSRVYFNTRIVHGVAVSDYSDVFSNNIQDALHATAG